MLDTATSIKGLSDENRAKFTEYGTILLTIAVIAIVFTAPLGAILINTLGIKWLSYDVEEEQTELSKVKPLEKKETEEKEE